MTHELNRLVLSVTGLKVSISLCDPDRKPGPCFVTRENNTHCARLRNGGSRRRKRVVFFVVFCVQNDVATTGQIRVDMYQLPYDSSTSVASPHKYAEKRISNWPVSINKPFFKKKKRRGRRLMRYVVTVALKPTPTV